MKPKQPSKKPKTTDARERQGNRKSVSASQGQTKDKSVGLKQDSHKGPAQVSTEKPSKTAALKDREGGGDHSEVKSADRPSTRESTNKTRLVDVQRDAVGSPARESNDNGSGGAALDGATSAKQEPVAQPVDKALRPGKRKREVPVHPATTTVPVDSDDDDFRPYHPLGVHKRVVDYVMDSIEGPPQKKKRGMRSHGKVKEESLPKDEDGDEEDAEDVKAGKGVGSKRVKQEHEGIMRVGKPKDAYIALMEIFVPYIDHAFDKMCIARCTATVTLKWVADIVDNGNDVNLTASDVQRLLRDLVFTKRKGKTLAEWHSPQGKTASQFKRKVMMEILKASRTNRFRYFVGKKDVKRGVKPSGSRPELPSWLSKKCMTKEGNKKPYVDDSFVDDTVDRRETTKDGKVGFKRRGVIVRERRPEREDIARYAMDRLYTLLLGLCTDARETARKQFFDMLGFLFLAWNEYLDLPVRDSVVALKWAQPLGESRFASIPESELPLCKIYTEEGYNEDDSNMALFTKTCLMCEEVTILAKHDIILRKNLPKNTARRREGNTFTDYAHAINLMHVILHLIQGSAGLYADKDFNDVLGAHPKSIVIIYTMARALRVLLSQATGRKIAEADTDVPTKKGKDTTDVVPKKDNEMKDGSNRDDGPDADGPDARDEEVGADAAQEAAQHDGVGDEAVRDELDGDGAAGDEAAGDEHGGDGAVGDDGVRDGAHVDVTAGEEAVRDEHCVDGAAGVDDADGDGGSASAGDQDDAGPATMDASHDSDSDGGEEDDEDGHRQSDEVGEQNAEGSDIEAHVAGDASHDQDSRVPAAAVDDAREHDGTGGGDHEEGGDAGDDRHAVHTAHHGNTAEGCTSDGMRDNTANKNAAESDKSLSELADELLQWLLPTEIPIGKALFYATCSVEEQLYLSQRITREDWQRRTNSNSGARSQGNTDNTDMNDSHIVVISDDDSEEDDFGKS